jgi:hypothetical protein
MGNYRPKALPPRVRTRNIQLSIIDTMPDDAKIYFREEKEKGTSNVKLSLGLKEKYGIAISPTAVSTFLRKEVDQMEIAKQRMEQTREWAQALINANSNAGGEVDTNKVLMNLIQGDVLQFVSMNKDAMQEKARDLTLDRLADISYKMAKVNIQNEKLALRKKASEVFFKLEEKGKQDTPSNKTKDTPPIPAKLKSNLEFLLQEYGQEQLKAALIEGGIIAEPKSSQGLDPETLRTIREDVYGIFK